MMMVPYMFNDDLMDDLFNDNWERDFLFNNLPS